MQGLRPEWIIPHPDDIDINTRTGEVKFMSPMSRKEKADLDYFYDRVEEYRTLQCSIGEIRSKMVRAFVEGQIADARGMRDMIVSRLGEPNKRRRG
jgi:hypothetical protein